MNYFRRYACIYCFMLCSALFLFPLSSLAQLVCTINSQYAKKYVAKGLVNQHFLLELNDRSIFSGGPLDNKMLLVKTNLSGELLWSKNYSATSTNSQNFFTQTVIDKDGDFICGFQDNYFSKIDADGNPSSTLKISKSIGSINFLDIKVLDNGDKIILFKDAQGLDNSYILIRTSFDLKEIMWSKYFHESEAYYQHILLDGDKILLAGFISYNVSILSFSADKGSLTKQVSFNVENRKNTVLDIYKYNGGYLLQGYLFLQGDSPTEDNNMIVRLSDELEPVKAYRVINIDKRFALTLAIETNGSFYGAFGWKTSSLMRVSSDNKVEWARSYDVIPTNTPAKLLKSKDGLIMSGIKSHVQSPNESSWFYSLQKSDLDGKIRNCAYNDIYASMFPLTFKKESFSVNVKDSALLTISNAYATVQDVSLSETTTCSSTMVCNQLQILGSKKVCSSNQANFIGKRNKDCSMPIEWKVVGDSVEQQVLNDSTLGVSFFKSGMYKVIGKLESPCGSISDTVEVNVFILPETTLSLGNDTTLCYRDSLSLKAQVAYTSYSWQDKTTGPSYVITKAGSYYLTTINACGDVFSDTIKVSMHPRINLDLGPDVKKCNYDSLTINAPAGFVNYKWSPFYGISDSTSKSVSVFPDKELEYRLQVKNTDGCYASDSIKVLVHRSIVINLGEDKNLCSGDSIYLDAGPDFKSYEWSTGEKTKVIKVNTKGIYSVIGSSKEGCRSYDTLNVLNVFPNPIVTLNKDSIICGTDFKELDAGYGFQKYLWNNGKTTRTLEVNSVNKYWVTVQDINGCVGSDSTRITSVFPKPQHFLPSDTAICSFSDLNIRSVGNYRNYLWSTGELDDNISVKESKTYWLQVTDKKGCIGRDYITVKFNVCPEDMYFPSAFTPNGDGKNDIFRPLVYKKVFKYYIAVYNRVGQKVFESRELSKGWDGRYAGQVDNTSTYVWMCQYQLEGQALKFDKGTVTIIR